ncbi:MAG: flagellar biosynthesis protein FliQ [Pseudomonadota bacterium]
MTQGDVLSLFGDALWLVVLLVALIVLPSLLVGLVVAVFQAATQINEQTLSFLPRLLATLFAIMLFGPWMLNRLIEFSHRIVSNVPGLIG